MNLAFLSITIAVVTSVAPRDASLASALRNTSYQVEGAVGIVLLSTIAAARMNSVRAVDP